MTELVPAEEIERVVGVERHQVTHFARAVSADETVYVLHSHECLDDGRDLRRCRYSMALDRGIERHSWAHVEDQAVHVAISDDGRLVPNTAQLTELETSPDFTATDTRVRLNEIRERADAATEGPWERGPLSWEPQSADEKASQMREMLTGQDDKLWVVWSPSANGNGSIVHAVAGDHAKSEVNAVFQATARTDVPRLVDALTAVLDEADEIEEIAGNLTRKREEGVSDRKHEENKFEARVLYAEAKQLRKRVTTALEGGQ